MKHLIEYILENQQESAVFVVLKPGSLDLGQTIIERFAKDGWQMTNTIIKHLTPEEARKLYWVHRKEDFYTSLWKYMSSAPCRAFIFTKKGSIKPFTEVKAIKDEIREKYGESEMRNVLHSSDSPKNMDREAPIFFTKTW